MGFRLGHQANHGELPTNAHDVLQPNGLLVAQEAAPSFRAILPFLRIRDRGVERVQGFQEVGGGRRRKQIN